MKREDTLKIATVMSDPTRYDIYRYILSFPDMVTVQDIADQFTIHPNVARLHLNKLEEAGMVTSDYRKPGSAGGRPAKIYGISDHAVSLNFPPRDFQLLSDILLDALSRLGPDGLRVIKAAGRDYGRQMARKFLNARGLDPVTAGSGDLLNAFQNLMSHYELQPAIVEDEVDPGFDFKIGYCTFKEVASSHPDLVCQLHRFMILGAAEEFFGEVQVKEEARMTQGELACIYAIEKD